MAATPEGVSQVASALTSIAGDEGGTLSEESASEATGLVGKNLDLMMALPEPPTADAAVATLDVLSNLVGATASSRKNSAGVEAGSGERLSEAGSGGANPTLTLTLIPTLPIIQTLHLALSCP